MSVRIIGISPKKTPMPTDPIIAHLSIEDFKWINEQTQKSGVSSRSYMFDWIVNKNGTAYIKKGDKIFLIFGAKITNDQYIIRAVDNGVWADYLLELPEIE